MNGNNAENRDYPDGIKFLHVGEVQDILGCSKSKAYKIMRQLNRELEEKGKITVQGRVSRKYLEKRCIY